MIYPYNIQKKIMDAFFWPMIWNGLRRTNF